MYPIYCLSPESVLNDRNRFVCRCTYYTWASNTAASSCFSSHDCKTRLDLQSSRFTDDKPSKWCVWISFWVLYKEDSVRTAVPMIMRPGFSMSCEIIWMAHSGKHRSGSTSKWNSGMCGRLHQQGSVGLHICSDLRGFLTVTAQQYTCTHMHTHTCWSSFVPNTLWCCLHLPPWWMVEG